jgi:hypothetical protein
MRLKKSDPTDFDGEAFDIVGRNQVSKRMM